MLIDAWGKATASRGNRRAQARRLRWSVPILGLAALVGIGLALRPSAPVQSAPLAPDFSLPVTWGAPRTTLALSALRGHPVLLNFFNSTCPPCIAEMPVLRQTARLYRANGLVVLGVATGGDTTATARAFAAAQHLPYVVVVDQHQDVAWRYGVWGWPTSFFVDAQGRVQGQSIGPLDARTMRGGLAQIGAARCDQCDRVAPPSLLGGDAAPSAATLSADTVFSSPRQTARFALRDQTGAIISPNRLRGKVVALTFVSAACRSECPLVGRSLAAVAQRLGRDARRLAIVAISVDPEQDAPAVTRAFAVEAGWRGADWHYLTAPRPVLARVWKAYWVFAGPPPKPGQDPAHQAGLYLIDARARLRAYYDVPLLAPRVAASVRALLSGQ